MSALVSVTICTADRQIFRFDDLESASRFRLPHAKSEVHSVPPRADQRRHGDNRRLVLAYLAEREGTMVDLATHIGRTVNVIKRLVDTLVDHQMIEIARRGARGQRTYRITPKGRAEVSRHV